jgi:hypothetical protein
LDIRTQPCETRFPRSQGIDVPCKPTIPPPGRVSHGCLRMSNAAALVLKRLTPAGTPLRITG